MEQELPGAEDLDGAARALMRLQDVYALSVKGMANGVFQPAGASRPPLYSPGRRVSLSADDCFHVGKVRANPVSPPQSFSSLGCGFHRDRLWVLFPRGCGGASLTQPAGILLPAIASRLSPK